MIARTRVFVAGTVVTLVTVLVLAAAGGEMVGAREVVHDSGKVTLVAQTELETPASAKSPGSKGLSRAPADTRPEDYGAVGNDGKDDSRAVQRAVDVAARRGSIARLSKVTYRMDSALRVPSHGKVVGKGLHSVLKFTWIYNNNRRDGYYVGNREQIRGDKRIKLRRFTIVGHGTGLPSGPNSIAPQPWVPAVRMRTVNHLVIKRVHIRRAPGISMLLQAVKNALIEQNRINRSGRDGINVGWFEGPSTRVVVKRNVVRRIGDDGLAVVGYPVVNVSRTKAVNRVRLVRNKVLGWHRNVNGLMLGRGISVLGARRVKVLHNTVKRSHSAGILVSGAGRGGLVDPATGKPWRSHRIVVTDNRIVDGSVLSIGSDDVPTGLLGGFVCKSSNRVEVRRNRVEASVGFDFRYYGCTRSGPQGE